MPRSAPPDAAVAAIDALFAAPLAEFTAARNQLAASLKKAGDAAGAARVKALAKPSATAWAVNQVWWRRRDVLERVLDTGAAQRAALVAWSHGRAADLRATAEARDTAVRAAIDVALQALSPDKPAAPDAHYRISGTIQALASSGWPEGTEAGRLTHDLQSSGLEALGALADRVGPGPTRVPGAGRSSRGAASAPRPVEPRADPASPGARGDETGAAADASRRRAAAARARVKELEALHADTGATARDTRTAAETARAHLEQATARRAALEAELEEARQAESTARRGATAATAAAAEAEMKHARTSRELAAARLVVGEE